MSINLSGRALKRLRLPVVNYYSSAYQVMSAQAGDVNTRYLDVVLYDDRGDIDLSVYSKVYLQVQAYDGISPQMSEGWIDTERNRAVCRLTSSMLQYTGSKMPCNIWLVGTDADDEPMSLTSQTFYVMVYEGHGGADAEPSEDELTVLQSAINDVVELEKTVGEAEANRQENFRSVYIKYSFDANGYNYTDSWQQGQQYMGVANTPKEPEDATGYSWILISGGSSGGSAVTVVGKNGYGFYRLAGEYTADTTNVATEDILRRADREVQAGDMLITPEGLIFVLDEYDADNDTQKVSYYTDIGGGDVSEEAIAAAVEMYMSENEIDGSGADDIDIVDSDGSYKLILTKGGEHIGSGVNMPTYTAEDVGAAEKDHDHDEKYQPKGNYAAEGHDHDGKYQPVGNYLPTEHNTATDSHNDIRLLIQGLDARLTALADSDDTTLDQLSELVAYIKSNRDLIESITTDKVDVDDIINNLTTTATDKPLSAAQGVALKALIDNLTTTVNGKQTAEQVATAISNALKAYPTTTAMQTAISTALAAYAKADHNHDGTYIKQTELDGAVNTALQTAKESGDFDGTSVTISSVTESTESGGENKVIFSDGNALTVKNGTDGETPVKGTDYYTPEEKAEIIQEILAELGAAVIGYIDGNTITVKGNLAEGVYTAYYEVDGELVEIGELSHGVEPVTYTITWKNDDGSVLKTDTVKEGTVPSYSGATPTKASDGQYNYTFKAWSPTIVAATANAIYTATYNQTAIEVETYRVTFVADGTTVATVTYEKGATSVEEPAVPEKTGYTGAWKPYTLNNTNITVEAEYTAKTYTITWNVDGVETSETYKYGDTPSFKGSTDKAADDQYTYAFSGWSPAITTVSGDKTYTAQYTQTEIAPAEPTNFFDASGDGYLNPGRLSSGGANRTDSTTCIISNYILVQTGDVVFVDGANIAPIASGTNTHYMSCYDSDQTHIASLRNNTSDDHLTFDSVTTTNAQITVTGSTVAYLRFTLGGLPSNGDGTFNISGVVINIKRNGVWL